MPLNLQFADLQSEIVAQKARWTADVTSLSRLQDSEKLRRLGATPPGGADELAQREQIAVKSIGLAAPQVAVGRPAAWDWRNVGGKTYITPVRDQSSCGSCVAFGSIAATEAMINITSKEADLSIDLSEAELFYCDASTQGRNCQNGWWVPNALQFLTSPGIADEACFPYSPGDQPCKQCADWALRTVKITGSHAITDVNAMKAWISGSGPLITCFTVYDDFYSYRSGVYHHVTGAVAGGHCVCVVGYDDNAQCWICKNSWGSGWGEGGFFQIAYGQCGIDAEMWAIEGVSTNKVTLADTSRVTPGLAVMGDDLVLAWTGTDNPSHLNVMTANNGANFGGKVILGETSFDGPAIAAGGGRLFIGWTGVDAGRHLNVMSSTDCRTFTGKVTLGDSGAFGPALAYMNGRLFLAWVGTDSARSLNVMSSTDNGANWSGKVTLGESSDGQVALCAANGTLFLIWQGTDSNSSLNLMQSTDGHNWSNIIVLADSSDQTPAAVQAKELVLAWTGRDGRHSLNQMVSSTGSHGFGGKQTLADTAVAGVALATIGEKVFIAWGGTDSSNHLNVMTLIS